MDVKVFTQLLENPGAISASETTELEKILKKSPYFQAARAIQLKGLKEHREFSYNAALKKTAAYTTDRSILFDFITSKEFNQNRIADQIKKQEKKLSEIPVHEAEQVYGKRSLEIDEAIKMKQSESDRVMDPALFEKPKASEETKTREDLDSQENAEKQLEIGKPLEFDSSESHSFSEWLQLTKTAPLREKSSKETQAKPGRKQSRKFELIDQFISKSPKLKPAKTTSKSNLAKESLTAPEALMTETLAKVYLEQKNYKKSIQAYKILILKNPEKSGFFADQIRAIKKLQENNIT